ncbi:hypothetical protein AB0D66_22005 [Streptomyces sp. NPDC048270]|uniref:hypothetical protein n=1 Tax=Streptomyces sp. NPDC048270 TaxID=3154615 RepID=UPI003406A6C8
MSRTLSVTEYRTLLHDALSAILDTDALTMPAALMYTPSAHRPALYADSCVVRGGPGEGKTFWVRALTDPRMRAVAAREYLMPRLERTEAVVGYGVQPETAQPTAGELRAFTALSRAPCGAPSP